MLPASAAPRPVRTWPGCSLLACCRRFSKAATGTSGWRERAWPGMIE